MAGPRFFVDRSLGRIRLPGMLRSAGWDLVTLAEHYGMPQDEHVTDVEWLELAGSHGWAVLMKDAKIRYRPAERAALRRHAVRAFCLTSGNLSSAGMADLLIAHREAIWRLSAGPGPALFTVSGSSIRETDT